MAIATRITVIAVVIFYLIGNLIVFFVLFFFAFLFFFEAGEWVNGCWSNVLFTAAVELQMSGFEPSLFPLFVLFSLCVPLFFLVGEGG